MNEALIFIVGLLFGMAVGMALDVWLLTRLYKAINRKKN